MNGAQALPPVPPLDSLQLPLQSWSQPLRSMPSVRHTAPPGHRQGTGQATASPSGRFMHGALCIPQSTSHPYWPSRPGHSASAYPRVSPSGGTPGVFLLIGSGPAAAVAGRFTGPRALPLLLWSRPEAMARGLPPGPPQWIRTCTLRATLSDGLDHGSQVT